MAESPIEDVIERRLVIVADGADSVPEHGDDVDPARPYAADRLVPLDQDEWREDGWR